MANGVNLTDVLYGEDRITIEDIAAKDLQDLGDVENPLTPANGQVLQFNIATGEWQAVDATGAGYSLPVATDLILGGVIEGGDIAIDGVGIMTIVSFPSHTHLVSDIDSLLDILNDKVNTSQVLTDVPSGAVFTDTLYDDTDVLKDADTVSPVDVGNKLITETELAAFNGDDEVVEYINVAAFPVTGETGILYIAADVDLSYRWTGTNYAVLGTGVTDHTELINIGTNTHAQIDTHLNPLTVNPHNIDKADVGLANVDNTADNVKVVAEAHELVTARTISLSGDVTGSVSFDGSLDVDIVAVIQDDSHNHIIANVDGLQVALDSKAEGGDLADLQEIYQDTNEPSGFVRERPNSMGIMEFSPDGVEIHKIDQNNTYSYQAAPATFGDGSALAARRFIIYPVPSYALEVYIEGSKYEYFDTKSLILTTLEGFHFIYFDNTGVLHTDTNFSVEYFEETPIVSFIYGNATTANLVEFANERHGITMDGATHRYLHFTQGTQFISGMGLNAMNLGGTTHGPVNGGELYDEDIFYDIALQTNLPFWYKLNTTWDTLTADNLLAYTDSGDTLVAWNEDVAGNWQLTEAAQANDCFISFMVATNNAIEPYIKLMAQASYANVSAAQLAIHDELTRIVLSGLPSPEFVFIAAYIVDGNGQLQALSDGAEYLDLRTLTVAGGAGSSGTTGDHLALLNVGNYTHVEIDTHIDDTDIHFPQTILTGTVSGIVIAEGSGDTALFLNGDGLWSTPEGGLVTPYNYIATLGQTTFAATYAVGSVAVYLSGVKIHPSLYTATNGTSVILNTGVDTDTWVHILASDAVAASVVWANITATPTTILGYGITDAVVDFADLGITPTTIAGYGITDAVVDFADLGITPTTLLGYGITDAAADDHIHSIFDYVAVDLSGATVFDNIDVTDGIVTAIGTRELTPANIGAEVADADIVKYDVAGSFTTAQSTGIDGGDNSISFNNNNNFAFTATATTISVTNQTVGQSGTLVIATANLITGWGTEFDWGNAGVPTDLTGTETFGYFISASSGTDSIKIGRV